MTAAATIETQFPVMPQVSFGHLPTAAPERGRVFADRPGVPVVVVGGTGPTAVDLGAIDAELAAAGVAADAAYGSAAAAGAVRGLNAGARRWAVVAPADATPLAARRAAAAAIRELGRPAEVLLVVAGPAPRPVLEAVVEGAVLARFDWKASRLQRLEVFVDGDAPLADPDELLVTTTAGVRARALASMPSNVKSPAWFADMAVGFARDAGLQVQVWDEHDLARDGFGGLLAVGMGSTRPPRFIRLDYTPAGVEAGTPDVVVVAKGITFDSGGLNIKGNDTMKSMKRDMSAAGATLSAMCALGDARCPLRVTALLAMAENMPSGTAYRPDDVVTAFDGTTIEIMNTDAEGRIVLADALGYAATLGAPVTIDLATLTGAATKSLGRRHGALYGTDDHVVASLAAAGQASGEFLWPMPLVTDYESDNRSTIADIAQIATAGKYPVGSIFAAQFLQRFAPDGPWAHLDVAGVSESESDEYERTRGATGFGARMLVHWLRAGGTFHR